MKGIVLIGTLGAAFVALCAAIGAHGNWRREQSERVAPATRTAPAKRTRSEETPVAERSGSGVSVQTAQAATPAPVDADAGRRQVEQARRESAKGLVKALRVSIEKGQASRQSAVVRALRSVKEPAADELAREIERVQDPDVRAGLESALAELR